MQVPESTFGNFRKFLPLSFDFFKQLLPGYNFLKDKTVSGEAPPSSSSESQKLGNSLQAKMTEFNQETNLDGIMSEAFEGFLPLPVEPEDPQLDTLLQEIDDYIETQKLVADASSISAPVDEEALILKWMLGEDEEPVQHAEASVEPSAASVGPALVEAVQPLNNDCSAQEMEVETSQQSISQLSAQEPPVPGPSREAVIPEAAAATTKPAPVPWGGYIWRPWLRNYGTTAPQVIDVIDLDPSEEDDKKKEGSTPKDIGIIKEGDKKKQGGTPRNIEIVDLVSSEEDEKEKEEDNQSEASTSSISSEDDPMEKGDETRSELSTSSTSSEDTPRVIKVSAARRRLYKLRGIGRPRRAPVRRSPRLLGRNKGE